VFNNGVNPRKGGVMSDGSNIREEISAIIYVSKKANVDQHCIGTVYCFIGLTKVICSYGKVLKVFSSRNCVHVHVLMTFKSAFYF